MSENVILNFNAIVELKGALTTVRTNVDLLKSDIGTIKLAIGNAWDSEKEVAFMGQIEVLATQLGHASTILAAMTGSCDFTTTAILQTDEQIKSKFNAVPTANTF